MIKQQIIKEIHRNARQNFERRKYTMRGIANTLQADLADMQWLAEDNDGYRYFLIAIDIFSKKAYAEPLKDKKKESVVVAMEKIFRQVGKQIQHLHTDKGTEFYNRLMTELLVKYNNINHYSTKTGKKASIVERLIRTIKRKLYMEMHFQSSWQWYKNLKKIIDKYNNTR